jgi:hypothetical protein
MNQKKVTREDASQCVSLGKRKQLFGRWKYLYLGNHGCYLGNSQLKLEERRESTRFSTSLDRAERRKKVIRGTLSFRKKSYKFCPYLLIPTRLHEYFEMKSTLSCREFFSVPRSWTRFLIHTRPAWQNPHKRGGPAGRKKWRKNFVPGNGLVLENHKHWHLRSKLFSKSKSSSWSLWNIFEIECTEKKLQERTRVNVFSC